MPMIIPWRRWSNGSAASSTTSSVAAAPVARKPAPIQPIIVSEVASSAATITTRRQRPARIQSSASATAWVVLAQAQLICVFGPRAPISSANWEWPIESTRNRKRRSNAYGSCSSWCCEVVDAALHLGEYDRVGALVVEHPRPQRLERRHALAAHAVGRCIATTSSVISSRPGNAEAKMTPVSSRSSSGSDQRSGSCVPLVVVL